MILDFYRWARAAWARSPARGIDREDALQAAVFRCWRYRDSHDVARPARPYFATIIRTELIRQADYAPNHPLRTCNTDRMRTEDAEPTVDAADLSCKLDWLRHAMTPADAEVLIPLHAGETQREVGRRLGLTRDQVQRRKNAALSRLTIAARRDTLTLQQ